MASLLTAIPVFVVLLSILIMAPPFDKGVIVGDFDPGEYTGKHNPLSDPNIIVEDIFFSSHGDKCHAWLYSPPPPPKKETPTDGEEEPTTEEEEQPKFQPRPVVVMASGFGNQKDVGLDRYAERFVQAGYAVFTFDYRSFGPSSGTPRNWVSPKRHIQDYHAAIEYIESLPENLKGKVDPSKILLWGTSYSGGHVLEVASQRLDDANIKGIVSQVPHLSGSVAAVRGIKRRGIPKTLRMFLATAQDLARQFLDMPPVCAQIIGSGNDLAAMLVEPEEHQRYISRLPEKRLGGWQNQVPARSILDFRMYNPLDTLKKQQSDPSTAIKIPILIITATLDTLTPPDLAEEAAQLLPTSKMIRREATHFAIYDPDNSIPVADEMAKFYNDCLAS
ncbi:Uncharacterized 31.7 kDa protein in traX-finO intergenic region [Seminavis robusta]|uniref:Uncharacterized 31.7 kDa protein in traX-finO intergenic region n=1 Tax=Seminavis robusta TaxID=568900 RepID=A0A9N8EZ36_9STRA|nr:Uncharacterized 31.7 kDa protein in traX-finO intergenic region [Seminavis robusta]|eukprot:Sro2515_g329900.1 Uncharacterized 31.7 kDa protein in traX-finO intergenic region (390) ;mRNA; r:12325-13494